MNARHFGIFENAEVLEVLEQGKPSGLTPKGLHLIMGNEAYREKRAGKGKHYLFLLQGKKLKAAMPFKRKKEQERESAIFFFYRARKARTHLIVEL